MLKTAITVSTKSTSKVHFLKLPFYETGRIKKNKPNKNDDKLMIDIISKIKPHQIYAAGDLADPHGTHAVCIQLLFKALKKLKKESFMKDIGLNKTGINKLIKEGYDLLQLNTFFTSGPEESRAWTVKKNTPAPKAASVIHTDFEKNFIRAETVSCDDFLKYGSAEKCKENGKLRIEGKDYIVKDGDVLYFRVNP